MTANVELLEEIHALFAEQIKMEILEFRAEGMPVPAADKAVYAKFLRDNNIFCAPKSTEDLMELRKQLINGDRDKAIANLKREINASLDGDDFVLN